MFKIQIDAESPDFQTGSQWTLFGLFLELAGVLFSIPHPEVVSPASLFLYASGAIAIVVGVFHLAKSKHRSPMWAIMGLLSLLGWTLVAFIEDRSPANRDSKPEEKLNS